jgi:hypothetical protein
MIKSVKVKGSMVTIDWDQEDYDFFFRAGLQILCDECCNGKRKVVVVPASEVKIDKSMKTVEVSDEFALSCVELAVIQAIRDGIKRYETESKAVKPGKKAAHKAKSKVAKKVVNKTAKKVVNKV